MPTAVEQALAKAASKMAASGKLKKKKNETLAEAKSHFVYGRMTNLQKAGSIPAWRKLK